MTVHDEGEKLPFRMWHQELCNALIEQGLQGYTQKAIIQHFKNRVSEDEVIGYLELLLKEEKVQKFRYRRHYYWRATINISRKSDGNSV